MSTYEAAVEIREVLATVAEEIGGIRDLLRERMPAPAVADPGRTRRLRVVHFEDVYPHHVTDGVNALLATTDPADVQRVGDVRWEYAGPEERGLYRCTVVVVERGPGAAS